MTAPPSPLPSVATRLAAAATLLAACGRPDVPDVLVVTLDTLRADRLGCYGHGGGNSPALDRLAASGVVFDQAIAQAAITPVSHASILTGLFPHRHGLRSLHGGREYALAGDVETLAERLRGAGYETGAFVSAFPATRHFGLDQGFDAWDEDFTGHDGRGRVTESGVVNTGDAQRRGDETARRAAAWLAARSDAPFFCWVHLFDVHDPVLLPPDDFLAGRAVRAAPPEARRLDLYDAEVAWMDRQVEAVLAALGERRTNTIVAVLADHGQGLGDHGWWGHTILYQEQIRVPFLLALPGVEGGRRLAATVRTVDLVPTVLDYAGLARPGGQRLDGSSLRGLIEGVPEAPRLAYSETLNDLSAYYGSPLEDASLYAVVHDGWKLIARYRGERFLGSELYHLAEDPGETTNVVRDHLDVFRALRARLDALDAVAPERPPVELDAATKARLEALGYVR